MLKCSTPCPYVQLHPYKIHHEKLMWREQHCCQSFPINRKAVTFVLKAHAALLLMGTPADCRWASESCAEAKDAKARLAGDYQMIEEEVVRRGWSDGSEVKSSCCSRIDLISFLAPTQQLTTFCNSNFRGSGTLFCSLWALNMDIHGGKHWNLYWFLVNFTLRTPTPLIFLSYTCHSPLQSTSPKEKNILTAVVVVSR